MITLQKDLSIKRSICNIAHESGLMIGQMYEYQLKHQGQVVDRRYEHFSYPLGIVTENPNGSLTMELRQISQLSFSQIEDDNVFVLKINN